MAFGIRTLLVRALFALSLHIVCLSSPPKEPVFTNTYAVHISGGLEHANHLAEKHGFVNLGEILDNHYHFLDSKSKIKRSIRPNTERHLPLKSEHNVHWIEQQVAKIRSKRDNDSPMRSQLNDPKWPLWYLQREPGLDMNVIPAWKKGYTGTGVVVSILDDGIEKNHPDLSANYDAEASYDLNDHDEDPQPRYTPGNINRHGTRCAGEVAAMANNSICSVGIAYNARIGGVRMLDGDVTDAVEAKSLSHRPDHVDIYSASWGPDDDGKTVDGPGPLANKAFCDGITKGRAGLGSIFVWASGNGGRSKDSCNCDGYTNSIFTISVSSVSERGDIPWYSEPCASTIATTYSSGSTNEKEVITTDLNLRCTDKHSGTSASAPLAAGICALALQANPHLTWRDLQHIIVLTSRSENLHAPDWTTNGVGRKVSHSYGFGLMDADAMVTMAKTWNRVPEQHVCTEKAPALPKDIPGRGKLIIDFNTTGCAGSKNYVQHLEHVHARITLSFTQRGALTIKLVSPLGTRSTLLPARPRDNSAQGFRDWDFMSTHPWGENPSGVWSLIIENTGGSSNHGVLDNWTLVLYGTEVHPLDEHVGPNSCPEGQFLATKVQQGSASGNSSCPKGQFLATEKKQPGDTEKQPGGTEKQPGGTEKQPGGTEKQPGGGHGVSNDVSNCSTSAAASAGGSNASIVHTCQPCHHSCQTCFGPSGAQCLTCPYSYIKRDVYCITASPYGGRLLLSMVLLCVGLIVLFLLLFLGLQAYSQGLCSWWAGSSFKETGLDYEYQELTKELDSDNEGEESHFYREKHLTTASPI